MPFVIQKEDGSFKIVARRTYQRLKKKYPWLVAKQVDSNEIVAELDDCHNQEDKNLVYVEPVADEENIENCDVIEDTYSLQDENNTSRNTDSDFACDQDEGTSITFHNEDASMDQEYDNEDNEYENVRHSSQKNDMNIDSDIHIENNDDIANYYQDCDMNTNNEGDVEDNDDEGDDYSHNELHLNIDYINDTEDSDNSSIQDEAECSYNVSEDLNVFSKIQTARKLHKNPAWDKIGQWAVTSRQRRNVGNQLLRVFKDPNVITSISDLPIDLRTLKKVPKSEVIFRPTIKKMCGGSYAYFGIEKNLCCRAYFFDEAESVIINLNFNTDGLKLMDSSKSKFWPILGQIGKARVFLIALFHGNGDPNDFNGIFEEFVEETIYLTRKYKDKFKVNFFTADSPAKAASLNVKYPTGYLSCLKCEHPGYKLQYSVPVQVTEGSKKKTEKVYSSNVHFSGSERHPRRKHADFVNPPIFTSTSKHALHHGLTVLRNIPGLDLVEDVVIDIMHPVYLDTVKKLVDTYFDGYSRFGDSSRKRAIIQATKAQLLYRDLEMLAPLCPVEFARNPRSAKLRAQWKAAEYRQILEYSGIVLFKKYLPESDYECFKTLAVALRILNTDEMLNNETLVLYTEKLMGHFIEMLEVLYGPDFITNAVHVLLHIPRDCKRFGAAITFSCFVYETFNFELCNNVPSGNNPLQQMINRYNENIYWGLYDQPEKKDGIYLNKFTLQVGNYTFRSDRTADSYFSTKLKSHYKIVSFSKNDCGEVVIQAQHVTKSEPFFMTPCDSRSVGIYAYRNSDLSEEVHLLKPTDIHAKYYGVPKDDETILIELLHAF